MRDIIINKLYRDDLGQISGIFLIDKPKGITSHDVVDKVRRVLKTKKVGHAGTLDPFATGLLIVLVGKYTKLSDDFMGQDKVYEADLALGISTNTHDPEGDVIDDIELSGIDETQFNIELNKFTGGYFQAVPVFSSVKVNGQKLRELARKYDKHEIIDNTENQTIRFYNDNGTDKVLEVSKRKIDIKNITLNQIAIESFAIGSNEYKKPIARVEVECSKGTYIRQLAYDIGKAANMPAMLTELRRTRIGEYSIQDSIKIADLTNLYQQD